MSLKIFNIQFESDRIPKSATHYSATAFRPNQTGRVEVSVRFFKQNRKNEWLAWEMNERGEDCWYEADYENYDFLKRLA